MSVPEVAPDNPQGETLGSFGIGGYRLGPIARRGTRLSLMAQLISQMGSVVATVLLARLLSPSDFGIIALGQSLLGAAALLSLAGVGTALVTQKGNLAVAASSYFWLTCAAGLGIVTCFVTLAPLLTGVLGQPDAAPYVMVMAFSGAMAIIATVPSALLQRKFRFGWLAASTIASSGTYFVVEITLAFAGFGAWAVVVGQLAGATVALIISFASAGWLPRMRLSWTVVRQDLALTSGMGAGQLLSYVQKNADYWAVSGVLGGGALGIYYVAYVLPNIVRLRLSAVLRQVMLPAYAAKDSLAESARLWRRVFPGFAGLGIPLLTGIAAVAGPLVDVLFGAQWLEAVRPMQVLAVATVADLSITSVGSVAIVHGYVRRYVVVLAIRAISTVGLTFGAVIMWRTTLAVALGVATASALSLVVQEYLLSRPLGIGLRTVARPLGVYLVLSAVMAIAISIVELSLPSGVTAVGSLAICISVGFGTYLGVGLVFARGFIAPVLRDARGIVIGR